MNVHHSINELRQLPGPVALAIGVFDGVHLGHQEVIRAAMSFSEKQGGTAVLMTFDPHPLRVLRPEAAPRLLCSTRHKLRILENLGVTNVLLAPFTHETAETSAQEFIGSLVSACQPLGFVSVGYTWSFGKNRQGNIHQLMELGEAHGFGVYGVPAVQLDGEVVSSTLIREAVRAGDFAKAKRLLGRDYTVLGEVVHGKHLGKELGFPTANIAVENEELPPNGVYAVSIPTSDFRLPVLNGVANLGLRPTVETGASDRALEVHLLDFDGDLYGSEMEITFVQRLREEKKFADIEELKKQIVQDIAAARKLFPR
ncbi:MAG: bifunctional riboflavin kinase/FAD synthetase [Verrucomicrobia bacterium]|nr:bifunctional riboflavin kinase/FAD synthetase [Verrucomicrobiota bacterium]